MKKYLLFLIVLLSFCFNWNRVEAKSTVSREEKGYAGLDYNRFRYYNPQTGSYISKDPIGLDGNNPNAYAYTHDSNVWTDPLGLSEETVTIFRVQGGSLTNQKNRSWDLIKIDPSGNTKISKSTLNISMGSSTDVAHAEYFAAKRGGDAKVYSFEVPKWMGDMIEEYSIPQANSTKNPLNQGGLAPKRVDPNQPGAKKFELPETWAKWLEEEAIPGSGKVTDPNAKYK